MHELIKINAKCINVNLLLLESKVVQLCSGLAQSIPVAQTVKEHGANNIKVMSSIPRECMNW